MNSKRRFLSAAMASGAAAGLSACGGASAQGPVVGPGLLTLTGAVRANRGPFDPGLDQWLLRHQIRFERAHVLDFDALTALPARQIRPTLEYDAQPHTLRGPLLVDVLRAAGASVDDDALALKLGAIDGFSASTTLGQVRAWQLIVATHLDGVPMALGGVGPLWAMLDADRIPELAARPLARRFMHCPWGLWHVAVGA